MMQAASAIFVLGMEMAEQIYTGDALAIVHPRSPTAGRHP